MSGYPTNRVRLGLRRDGDAVDPCDDGGGVSEKPPIAGRAAIGILKQRMVKEPIFEAASSRTGKFRVTAMRTSRD